MTHYWTSLDLIFTIDLHTSNVCKPPDNVPKNLKSQSTYCSGLWSVSLSSISALFRRFSYIKIIAHRITTSAQMPRNGQRAANLPKTQKRWLLYTLGVIVNPPLFTFDPQVCGGQNYLVLFRQQSDYFVRHLAGVVTAIRKRCLVYN